ncbi:hypothetical protein KO493_00035 [Tamlana agarivorans]|uniref:Uncharacterized protein n=1 Tax=Pseudotamlana agarivorans TaxID=481183 RepID=A0ACC5U458_9FLAO|nr:hypothetical protein [Tamlana agarivorans]MBU2949086.1 hypothetical protein [Tamlana agarivorans]
MNKITRIFIVFLLTTTVSFAQEDAPAASSSEAQANNPLANMTSLSFQNYYFPKLSEAPDAAFMNTTWLRFAKPISKGKLLLRASMPFSTLGMPNANGVVNTTSGVGDFNAFLSYNFVSNATTTMGIGPSITAPTASDDVLGSGKWQGGFAFVAFVAKSPVFQFGTLITWQASFAGDSDRDSTSLAAIQPFYFWQLGKGTYLRGVPIWVMDFEKEAYSFPIALGIGQVIKMGNTVFNMYVEPQYSIYVQGVQPVFQVLTGINLQFMK